MGLCLKCQKVSTSTSSALAKMLCSREKVTDVKLFHKGNHPNFSWTQRWKSMEMVDITEWASSEVKIILITQDIAGLAFSVRVREFVPVDGDSLKRSWKTRGVENHYGCTNYAIENMKAAGLQVKRLVETGLSTFIDFYVDRSDWLLYNTFRMALKASTDLEVSTV